MKKIAYDEDLQQEIEYVEIEEEEEIDYDVIEVLNYIEEIENLLYQIKKIIDKQ